MEHTGLARHFDELICAHSFNVPKEDARFWPRLTARDEFEPASTLFVDDSLPVLRAAQAFGIRHLRAVRLPDSKAAPKQTDEFIVIENFGELAEGLDMIPDTRSTGRN